MSDDKNRLKELASLFTRLGFIGFGGPAAHIALMRQEVVTKRGWVTEEHFLDLVGATHLIPGPNSTEMTMHIGQERAGWKGLAVAGLCFILPAVFITGLFAWLYNRYGHLPDVQPFIYGIKPAIIAIILAAIFPLARKSLKSNWLIFLGLAALAAALAGLNELVVFFATGLLALAVAAVRIKPGNTANKSFLPFGLLQVTAPAFTAVSNSHLFFTFLKIGSILYGSGYLLFSFLDAELVTSGILSRKQLIDAIAVGQFTPGPVFSSVTFVGYVINGAGGALAATVGVFLPSFFFVALLNPLVKRLRASPLFSAFLDAVNVASVALIAATCSSMAREAIFDWRTLVIAVISVFLTFGYKSFNSALIVLGSSFAGYLLYLL